MLSARQYWTLDQLGIPRFARRPEPPELMRLTLAAEPSNATEEQLLADCRREAEHLFGQVDTRVDPRQPCDIDLALLADDVDERQALWQRLVARAQHGRSA